MKNIFFGMIFALHTCTSNIYADSKDSLIAIFCEIRPSIVVCEYNTNCEDLYIIFALSAPNGYKLLSKTDKYAFFIKDCEIDFENLQDIKFYKTRKYYE